MTVTVLESSTILHYVEAWRVWWVRQENGFYLRSMSQSSIWPEQKALKAMCVPLMDRKLNICVAISLILSTLISVFIFHTAFGNYSSWRFVFLFVIFLFVFMFMAGFIMLFLIIDYAMQASNHKYKNPEMCICSGDQVPSFSGTCGIYGYKSKKLLIDNMNDFHRGAVLGRVAFWGNIVEHESGYRAQYAYPLSLEMGVCCQCGNVFPIDNDPVLLLYDSVCQIICRNCCARMYDRRLWRKFFWREMIAGSYGISVGSFSPSSNKFSTGALDQVF